MIAYCVNNLNQIKDLAIQISDEDYKKPCQVLFNSSVGQHIRHALEFYVCLLKGLDKSSVNYDERKRQHDIEINTEIAVEMIDKIIENLQKINQNQDIEVKANYTSDEDKDVSMHSTLYRELGFCLEHSIHHQALIKTGLRDFGCLNLIDHTFGIAASTLRNNKQCAQ